MTSTDKQPATSCFVAFGSNLGTPEKQVSRALDALAGLADSQLLEVSPWYRSRAVGPGTQPAYINGVVHLETRLAPLALLATLQQIENDQQRKRIQRWGPRTLDLDILLYGDSCITLQALTIPHPRLHERNFVLYPLYDLAPQLLLPDGRPLKNLLEQCSMDGLQLVEESSFPYNGD